MEASNENHEKEVIWTSVVDFDTSASLDRAMSEKEQTYGVSCEPCEKKIRSISKKNKSSPFHEGTVYDWKAFTDESTSHPQTVEEEVGRLLALKSYGILDSEREPIFERITAFASRTFNVPIALVSLVDLGRQWFMSNRGLGDVRETPRNSAFCAHSIYSTEDVFIVKDATKDSRFCNNPLVLGDPFIRFYAGCPLRTPEGYKIGTLCIIDTKPWPGGLSLTQKQNLMELTGMVMDAVNNRKIDKERINEERSKSIACTAHDLLTPLSAIQLNLSLLMEDKEVWKSMDKNQKELVSTSFKCTEIIDRICQNEIKSFRGNLTNENGAGAKNSKLKPKDQVGSLNVQDLVRSLTAIVERTPKHVPLSMFIHENVPKVIISDGIKLFRSALNYLTNACKHTKTGSIMLRIFVTNKDGVKLNEKNELYRFGDKLVFECVDTGPGVDIEKYPKLFRFWQEKDDSDVDYSSSDENNHSEMTNSGLGLQSVANNITSIGGDYGYRPRNSDYKLYRGMNPTFSSESFLRIDDYPSNDNMDITCEDSSVNTETGGSIFWFSVPLSRPQNIDLKNKAKGDENLEDVIRKKKRCLLSEKINEPIAVIENTTNIRQNNLFETSSTNESMKTLEPSLKPLIAAIKLNDDEKRAGSNSDMPPPPNQIPLRRQSSNTNKKRALVIDDSVTIRKSIDRALTKLGFHVIHACNGLEGLAELKNTLFGVTFCDFLMPIMDGLDCVKQYRDWEKNNRPQFQQFIIGISAHASEKDAERGLRAGMNKFMSKPIKLITLKEVAVGEDVIRSLAELENLSDGTCTEILSSDVREIPEKPDDSTSSTTSKAEHSIGRVCLLAHGSSGTLKALSRCIESRGFRVCTVRQGQDALRLLKMRHWDIVLIDEKIPFLPGTSCVMCFRDWEAIHRVVRQPNIYFLSRSYIHYQEGCQNIYPPGFDGALGKPVHLKLLYKILEGAGENEKIVSTEIVTN